MCEFPISVDPCYFCLHCMLSTKDSGQEGSPVGRRCLESRSLACESRQILLLGRPGSGCAPRGSSFPDTSGHVLLTVITDAQGHKQKHGGLLMPRLGTEMSSNLPPVGQSKSYVQTQRGRKYTLPGGVPASYKAKTKAKKGLKT